MSIPSLIVPLDRLRLGLGKVRFLGRLLVYDVETGCCMLEHGGARVIVDVNSLLTRTLSITSKADGSEKRADPGAQLRLEVGAMYNVIGWVRSPSSPPSSQAAAAAPMHVDHGSGALDVQVDALLIWSAGMMTDDDIAAYDRAVRGRVRLRRLDAASK
ncbi:hypothetical protein PYCC9005_003142 [Savitreella phatthalungensis]